MTKVVTSMNRVFFKGFLYFYGDFKQIAFLTLYLIETPFSPFANRAVPDHAALM